MRNNYKASKEFLTTMKNGLAAFISQGNERLAKICKEEIEESEKLIKEAEEAKGEVK